MNIDTSPLIHVGLGLSATIALILAVAWLVRRLQAKTISGSGSLQVVSGMMLGARERLVLVEVDDYRILIGVSPGGIVPIHVMSGSNMSGDQKNALADTREGNPRELIARMLQGKAGR